MIQSNDPCVRIGVGIDTSRYGHYVTFLDADLQPATTALQITESRSGYDELLATLEQLNEKHPSVEFHIRIDAAGQYAANLESFLRQLPFAGTISIGDPVRNANYRVVHFPKRKSDSVESQSVARFAVVERPTTSPPCPTELFAVREIASRLEAQTRQVTRHVNQLHGLLARVFPELATITGNVAAAWVLELLQKYPTPQKIARAKRSSIDSIPRLSKQKANKIVVAANASVASLTGNVAEQLVKTLVRQIRESQQVRRQYDELIVEAYDNLPFDNQLDSIIGIGKVTAAVLTAKIISIDRFETPEQLVGYFGICPRENTSGIDPQGNLRPGHKTRMSKKGNGLVRGYLYNASMSASQHNPACRALYQRLLNRGTPGNAALGHVMRKLLHLVFAIWKSGKPFDRNHYPWESSSPKENAAGRNQAKCTGKRAVTATDSNVNAQTDEVNRSTETIPSLEERQLDQARSAPSDRQKGTKVQTQKRRRMGVITPDTT
jgi:transposase